jgi:hypothetical protein
MNSIGVLPMLSSISTCIERKKLINSISQFISLTDVEFDYFYSLLDFRTVKKKVLLLREGRNDANRITDFTTFTLGIGIYYRYMPFKNSESKFLQGITTSTSVRYSQNVGTISSNNEFTFTSKTTNNTETIDAPNIGFANTPLIFNIGVGYTFGGK